MCVCVYCIFTQALYVCMHLMQVCDKIVNDYEV